MDLPELANLICYQVDKQRVGFRLKQAEGQGWGRPAGAGP